MRKLLALVLGMLIILNGVSGCRVVGAVKEYNDKLKSRAEKGALIIECMNEGDSETIYNMFSYESKKQRDLKERIKALLFYWKLLNLDTTEATFHYYGGSKEYGDGEFVKEHSDNYVYDCISCDGTEYSVNWYAVEIDESHPENVGLYSISLRLGYSFIFGVKYNNNYVSGTKKITGYDAYTNITAVISEVYAMQNSNAYLQCDDENKLSMLMNLVEQLSSEGTDEVPGPLIDGNLTETKILDGDLKIYIVFVDDGCLAIIIPDFEGEIPEEYQDESQTENYGIPM